MEVFLSPGARQSYWAIAFYLICTSALLGGCGSGLGRKSACDGLVYKEYGLSRKEYLPWAGEMIATLDRTKPRKLVAEGRDVFLFFKHEDTPEGAL